MAAKPRCNVTLCHCCRQPATDFNGEPKKVPICWDCIRHAGSVTRNCSKWPHRRRRAKRG